MTNHPNRKHDEDEPGAGEVAAEALEPAGISPADYAAHTSNGVPPGLKQDPAVLAAKAVAQTLGEHLPNMLFQAMTAALSQAVVQTATQQHMCATCIIDRIRWENAHRAEMETAMAASAQAAGVEPGSQEASRLDLAAFLPGSLRPGERGGMPGVGQAVTTFQGAEMCPVHVAQAAGVQPGRSPLLIANAAMSPAMLGQLAGAR